MTASNPLNALLSLVPWPLRSKIRHLPGIAGLQRAIVHIALDGKEFVHRVDAGPAAGINFHIRMPEDKGIWTGTYEVEFAARLANSVKPGQAAFDVGSWHGFFAGVMAAQGASEVHAFEPLPENQECLRRLIALNPGKSIVAHDCAVGERDGELDLLTMGETSMAKLETSTFTTDESEQKRFRVPVRSIDSMIMSGALPTPALMKIDVEGAEMGVLRGARQTLQASQPELFMEVHSSPLLVECRAFLEPLGYSFEHLDQDAAYAQKRDVFQIRAFSAASS